MDQLAQPPVTTKLVISPEAMRDASARTADDYLDWLMSMASPNDTTASTAQDKAQKIRDYILYLRSIKRDNGHLDDLLKLCAPQVCDVGGLEQLPSWKAEQIRAHIYSLRRISSAPLPNLP